MTRYTRETAMVILAAVVARLGFALYTGFTADDAYITFRFADNIARGLGFVYNEGQRVFGTTTPLFTLLMALAAFFRFPLPAAALVVSIAASAATAVVVYRFAVALRFRLLAFVPVLCYLLWPRSLPGETSGMETAVFTLLVTSALYFRYRVYDYYAVGMATLATLTRPEGALVLLLVGIAMWRRFPRRWWHYCVVAVSLIGPWVVFAWIYFGSPFPHTISAKTALYSHFGTMPFFQSLEYLLALHSPFGWALLAAAVGGAVWLYRSQRFGRLELLWLAAMFAFYLFSGSRLFFWYVVPMYPVYLLFASAALVPLWNRLPANLQHAVGVRVALAILILILLCAGAYRPAHYYREYQRSLESMHRQVGYFLYAEAKPEEVVAAEDIGYIGYYSQRTILDRDGLISPEAVPYNRAGTYLHFVLDYRPDWVVAADPSPTSPFLDREEFVAHYREVRSFSTGDSSYRIFRRQPEPDTASIPPE